MPDYDQSLFTGLVVRAATPRDIVRRLHQALNEASASSEVVASIRRTGGDVIATRSPEEFDAFLAQEGARYDRLIRQTGLKVE